MVDPGGLLAGNLYVHGGGDPTFGTRQLAELADTLVQDQGLREITGRVIGDESARFLAKLIREKRITGADDKPSGPVKTPGTGLEFIDTSFENAVVG